MKIKKAIIPAAGLGTRMLPITKAQPKEMVPVIHKPVIQYVVEEIYNSGIKEILIITGKNKRAIEDHFDKHDYSKKNKHMEELNKMLEEINIFYIRQKEQKGLGDAVRYAESFVDDEPFALLLGDTITTPPCTKMLIDIFEKYHSTVIALEKVSRDRIPLYGIIKGNEIEENMYKIDDMVEKPKIEEAPSNLGILGRYILTPDIFEYLKDLKPGFGGEIQLTDALRDLSIKKRVYGKIYDGKRYDIGNKLGWLKINVEFGLIDDEIGKEFGEWLKGINDRDIVYP